MAQEVRPLFPAPRDDARDEDLPVEPALEAETEEERERPGAFIRFASFIGRSTIGAVTLLFVWAQRVFVGADDSTAARSDVRAQLLRQVHISGVRALPLVCLVACGTGSAIVLQTSMAPTPPSSEFGRMLVVVVLRELAPLLTALIVVGHSGTAIAAELGPAELAMSAPPSGERRKAILWPRISGTTVALMVLSVYFAAVAMLSGYAVSQMLTLRTFDAVRAGFEQELAWFDAPLFLIKTAGLGAIVGYVSCRFALEAKSSPAKVAHAASRAYVWALLAGGAFSIGVTVVRYLITGAPQPP